MPAHLPEEDRSGAGLMLRYGANPHQKPARVFRPGARLPVRVLNGQPGYINFLDALNSWQLVRDLRQALGTPSAASFKHVSPAGAALAEPLDETLRKAYFVDDLELSPLATAYARARGADRVSSFGDWVALSDRVDESTARLLSREVSDGVIAPGYDGAALALLRKKRQGAYAIVEIDPDYQPHPVETRDVFGLTLEQRRNTFIPNAATLSHVVTQATELPEHARRDLMLSLLVLKYTQSNSVALALGGQMIGIGAGQQSRIHCTQLAAHKAEAWYLRQHPAVLGLRFGAGLHRPDRDNAIDQFIRGHLTLPERSLWDRQFSEPPRWLSGEEKREWVATLTGVSLGSDAFFPFRDSIDQAQGTGVRYVVQPGGSTRDADVIAACEEYGMVMVFTGVRLFHH